jgi:hypothetical protein
MKTNFSNKLINRNVARREKRDLKRQTKEKKKSNYFESVLFLCKKIKRAHMRKSAA